MNSVAPIAERQNSGESAWMARQLDHSRQQSASKGTPLRADDVAKRTRLQRALGESGMDVLIIFGDDNFTYVTGAALPFAPEIPDRRAAVVQHADGESVIICPLDWAEAIQQQGWSGRIDVYSESNASAHDALARSLVHTLEALGFGRGRAGVDMARIPLSIQQQLRQALPQLELVPADEQLSGLRMIKLESEVALLETAALHSEKGTVSALNHTEGTIDAISYAVWEFTERVRVHVGEFGGCVTGHVAAMQGKDAGLYFVPPHGVLREGNLVRLEVTNMYAGYWSNAARTVVVGEPTAAQLQAYRDNIHLKAAAVAMLKPGVPCSEVYAAVQRRSDEQGVWFWREAGVGHGVGTSEREAPYLDSSDATPLAPGMVVMVGVYTRGPEGELIVSKDTFAIQPDSPRLLSWYRNWDRLYAITGSTARHG
jgi:Xaa-Pro aminopeptidase